MQRVVVLALLFLLASGVAQAAGDPQPEVIYPKRTIHSFDGDIIDGDLSRPDGKWIESRKLGVHESLIKVRDSFRTAILGSLSGT